MAHTSSILITRSGLIAFPLAAALALSACGESPSDTSESAQPETPPSATAEEITQDPAPDPVIDAPVVEDLATDTPSADTPADSDGSDMAEETPADGTDDAGTEDATTDEVLAPEAAPVPFWNVDYDASTLGFTFLQNGAEETGVFKSWEADITFDPNDLASASAVVNIVLESIDIGEGASDRNQWAVGEAWFDANTHPMARFETTGFRSTGGNGYEADATLTMKGQSAPIQLPFDLVIEQDTATMYGEVVLDRTRFGVGSDATVSEEITVIVDLKAIRSQ